MMASKRSVASNAFPSEPKRRRKTLTINEKVELLDMLKLGKSYTSVGRHYGINESTVRCIKKEETNIRATAAITLYRNAKRVMTPRNKTIVKMESVLAVWISECKNNNILLDANIIRAKAKNIYEDFVKNDDGDKADDADEGTSTSFIASKGWFDKFQRRFKGVSLHREDASVDYAAIDEFVHYTFKTLIREQSYQPEQVFNMAETGLFWKRMPSRTFIMKEEANAPGFKAKKDRLTLVMCGNAAGFMIKPGIIYKSENPKALKNKNKNVLPVYWMHNPKARMTNSLISNWFHQCFIPEVRLYLAEKGLEFKVLLLLDNAEGYTVDLSFDGVHIEFLPPNTTLQIQPMDQGVIRAFKALYTQSILQNLVDAKDSDKNFTLKAYWRDYTIASCLLNIQRAVSEIKSETLNVCWKKMWPEVAHDKGLSPDEVHRYAVDKVVKLAKMLRGEGFNDMTSVDVNELIDTHSQPLSDEDLKELMTSAREEEEQEQLGVEEDAEMKKKQQQLPVTTLIARQKRSFTGVPLRYPPLHGAPHPGLEASHALHGQAQADLLPLPEAIPDDVNVVKKRHISILLDGDTPNINNIPNSELLHCPYCKYVGEKYKVDNHVKGHSSVKHKEFTIIKCGLSCRTATHFHCCYCAATLRNRLQLVRHLQIHQEEMQAAAPAQLPVAPAQLPVAPTQLPVAPAQLPVAPTRHPLAPAECSTATKASNVIEEHLSHQPQEWSPRQKQEEPQPPHIKKEEEEHFIVPKGERFEVFEVFPVIDAFVKSEDDQEESGGSHLDNLLAPISDDDTMSHFPDTDDEDSKADMSCETNNTQYTLERNLFPVQCVI
ncbi:tigger transposable element-derived protein 1-like isoform X2 [Entelurus aequoreus]|uniref:tigger transposable element-derived protein 1-like isoform X2 n=1 Tax=Entelurus aequoreus TaxID=161455 RepID=UPI002B1DCD62|nr:tigger transposable element-derived protein 1-like isoform X2 [Entelurus aequoreus]